MAEALPDSAALAWCRARGIRFEGGRLQENGQQLQCALHLNIPDRATDAVGLAYMLVLTEATEYDEKRVPGSLLWLRRWELWSESIDRAGYALLQGMRTTLDLRSSLDDAPAIAFSEDEFTTTHATLVLPMIFQWDALFVSETGRFAAEISHHGTVRIYSTADSLSEHSERFGQWKRESSSSS